MILMISASQPNIDQLKEDWFGRSPWLIKMDTVTKKWEAFSNSGANQSGGAGVAAAQFVIDHQAESVISGDFGPHAANAFTAAKIAMYLFTSEVTTVQQAVDLFLLGKLPVFRS